MSILAATRGEITAELPPEPYPGLRPFEPAEWAIFFGRETMTHEVIGRLAEQHLVVVHGSSGCGKSSLVRAGVLPQLALAHAASGKGWRTAVMRPSGGPLRNLARCLGEEVGSPPDASAGDDPATAWHDRLALGPAVLATVDAALPSDTSLCLLVDQFEELFRWARERSVEEAKLLVELLCAVAREPHPPAPNFFVILTMRSDYLGECARFEDFAETVNRCQYLLPRMDDFAILRAVHEPAVLYGGTVDPAVGDRLLFAARREEDALPILQHTLMRACTLARARHGAGNDGWTIALDDLMAIEGREGALSAHAEEVLADATCDDPRRLKAAEWIFRSLTDLDAEGRAIRRPCPFGELIAVAGGDRAGVQDIVEAFRARGCSFLTPSSAEPLHDGTEIDLAHEALIRHWRRLSDPERDAVSQEPAGWLWREVEDGQRWRALAVQARAFRNDPSATLSPATTEAYLAWWPEHSAAWAKRYARERQRAADEYHEVEALWTASKAALDVERTRLERERSLRRRAQFGTRIAIGLLAVVVSALVGLGWFF